MAPTDTFSSRPLRPLAIATQTITVIARIATVDIIALEKLRVILAAVFGYGIAHEYYSPGRRGKLEQGHSICIVIVIYISPVLRAARGQHYDHHCYEYYLFHVCDPLMG